MARGRCRCGENDCPECGPKVWDVSCGDPKEDDVDVYDEEEDAEIKNWSSDVGIQGCAPRQP